MKKILFACVHNAGRSQIAATFFNELADPKKARAISAGTEPAEQIHPDVVQAMREAGIDLAGKRPQKLTQELAQKATLLVTMGCNESCPYVPGLRKEDWPLTDPKGQTVEKVRLVRDEIRRRVAHLIQQEDWGKP